MIGNDVVDLTLAKKESNWKRPRFLNKIFTPAEQELILSSKNQDLTVWVLWSKKEAAYKIFNRETNNRAYNPIKFECVPIEGVFGQVFCKGALYFTKTLVQGNQIHTIATKEKNHLEQVKTISNWGLLYKIQDLPFILNHNDGAIPASISHHGCFKLAVYLDLFNFQP